MRLRNELNDPLFVAGIVVARGVALAPTPPALQELLDREIERAARSGDAEMPGKDRIRALLKRGGFKAAGRNKPASEYLFQAAREGRFPRLNNLVDVNNLLSLESRLPISLLDLERIGPTLVLRYGKAGERYVFNASGQEIELQGLLCACRQTEGGESVPLGNPVKDSMEGKLKATTADVVGVIYGTTDFVPPSRMRELADRFAALLREFGGASATQALVTGSQSG